MWLHVSAKRPWCRYADCAIFESECQPPKDRTTSWSCGVPFIAPEVWNSNASPQRWSLLPTCTSSAAPRRASNVPTSARVLGAYKSGNMSATMRQNTYLHAYKPRNSHCGVNLPAVLNAGRRGVKSEVGERYSEQKAWRILQ
jgi:hypothetical protein